MCWTTHAKPSLRLIHGYDEVDFDILWQVVTTDLPAVVKNLEKLLRKL
ncbi:MAG: DUF86 domain-containing protein [Chloroflexi bacterium]|nr:DUF86 domain-containing protein [Chloroflexota bacterium]MBI4490244.1 DUF86 domain-containing protein [Deltaproteobacteria bacterium]